MRAPAFQFYAAEYLADELVCLMSLEEEGAYIRALAFCWREGSIPADPEKLGRLLKNCSNQIATSVQQCFNKMPSDGSRLIHPRLEAERKKQQQWREKSSKAGEASGKARRVKKLDAEPTWNQRPTKVEPNMNTSFAFASSSSSLNTKQTTTTKTSAPKVESGLSRHEEIYRAFPLKVARLDAMKAIAKALERLRSGESPAVTPEMAEEFLLAAVKEFASSPAGNRGKFTPHPATWFNKGRYLDDRATWKLDLIGGLDAAGSGNRKASGMELGLANIITARGQQRDLGSVG